MVTKKTAKECCIPPSEPDTCNYPCTGLAKHHNATGKTKGRKHLDEHATVSGYSDVPDAVIGGADRGLGAILATEVVCTTTKLGVKFKWMTPPRVPVGEEPGPPGLIVRAKVNKDKPDKTLNPPNCDGGLIFFAGSNALKVTH